MTDLARAVALLEAGDWQAAHVIVQADESGAMSCWAHGIVHIFEGDLDNARYWYRQAGRALPARPDVAQEIAALRAALKES
jgi:hypothetical protein